MSKQPLTTWNKEKQHRVLVEKKHRKVEGLTALIETYEQMRADVKLEPDNDYIRRLKAKLHTAQHQLKAMAGATDL